MKGRSEIAEYQNMSIEFSKSLNEEIVRIDMFLATNGLYLVKEIFTKFNE